MSMRDERRRVLREVARRAVSTIGNRPTVERLEQAKGHFQELGDRRDLFPDDEFPSPSGSETERTFLVFDDEQGTALYAVNSVPGMSYRPHDHGGSWALIVAIAGQEKHYFYDRDPDKPGALIRKGELICEPGRAVSLAPEGIHSIEGVGDTPLFHLHLYGKRFEDQTERIEYDLESGQTVTFRVQNVGIIEDRR